MKILEVFSFVAAVSANPTDRNGRIINGEIAEPHQFPYQVVIHSLGGTRVRGGSLISTTAVLTSGNSFVPAEPHELIFGAVNRLENEPNQQRRAVLNSDWTLHPQYHPLLADNNVAIIRFAENPVILNAFVQTIDLPYDSLELFVGEQAYISGFGEHVLDGFILSDVLRYAVKTIMSNQACSLVAPGFITDSRICSIGLSDVNNSICGGDFGGPVAIRRQGRSLQVGIISIAFGACGSAGNTDINERVTSFLPWIVSTAQ